MRFFLGVVGCKWQEVTERDYILAERGAGFRPKGGGEDTVAAAAFWSGSLKGKVVYPGGILPEEYEPVKV